jgi:hypothetical protein
MNSASEHMRDKILVTYSTRTGSTKGVSESIALKKGSTQVNMPAIPFTGVTINGDTVNFPEDFKGKYDLLDFWSTGCPHCIVEGLKTLNIHLETTRI